MNTERKFEKNKWIILCLILFYFAAAYALMYYLEIDCVFVEFLGIPCPGCGMTRALLAVLKLDFWQAVKYNITTFFMPYVFSYVWFDFKHKIHKVFLILIVFVAIGNWIFKIIVT